MMKSKWQQWLLYFSLILNFAGTIYFFATDKSLVKNDQLNKAFAQELVFENQLKFFSNYIDLAYNFNAENYVTKQVAALIFLTEELRQLKAQEIETSQESVILKNVTQQARLIKIVELSDQEYLLFIHSELSENGKKIFIDWQVRVKVKQIGQNLSNPYGLIMVNWDRYVSSKYEPHQLFFYSHKISEFEFPCSIIKIENISEMDQTNLRLQDNNKKLRVKPTTNEPFTLKVFCSEQQFELNFQAHDKEHIVYFLMPETKSKTLLMQKSVAKKKAILTRDQIRKMLKEQVGLEIDSEVKIQK